MSEEIRSEKLSKDRILSYTAKKRAAVSVLAVVLSIVAVCFIDLNGIIPLIAIPVIIAAAFVVDKVFIFIRPDIYGKDMIRRGRSPIIATTTVVGAFTAICLLSGIVGYQVAMFTAKNANVVKSYQDIGDAIDFLQDSGLKDDYTITVYLDNNGNEEFRATADFVSKYGQYDEKDFEKFKNYEVNGNVVTVTIRAYNLDYNGEKVAYYVLNEKYLNAKIELKEGKINVVDYGQAFGIVLGATFGAVAQIAILIIVYIVGIIAAIVPSEIYFEKLIRNEARLADIAAKERAEREQCGATEDADKEASADKEEEKEYADKEGGAKEE